MIKIVLVKSKINLSNYDVFFNNFVVFYNHILQFHLLQYIFKKCTFWGKHLFHKILITEKSYYENYVRLLNQGLKVLKYFIV